jgi:hypothetical protein
MVRAAVGGTDLRRQNSRQRLMKCEFIVKATFYDDLKKQRAKLIVLTKLAVLN